MSREEQYMRRAIELALENVRSGSGGPFGALVVKDGGILAEGVNLVTSTSDPTAHAEVIAIRRACAALGTFQLEGCEIYTSCEPCPMCLGAIYWARPAKLYFGATHKDAAAAGFDDSFIYQQARVPVAQRAIPTIQVLRSESIAAFQAWLSSATKIPY